MEFVPVGKILLVRPHTQISVCKMYNFEEPGSLDDATRIFKEWAQQQSHFNKKDFSDRYLEATIIVCKGSIEQAKSRLDRMCTIRTLMPQFFGRFNCKTDFEHLYQVVNSILLPKLTEDHYRVQVAKFYDVHWNPSQAIHFYRHNIIMAEYVKAHDFLCGFIMIIDFSEASVLNFLKKMDPMQVKQILTIFIEGYGMRIKGIHIISESKFVDGLVSFLKKILSDKVGSRINVHKSTDSLKQFISNDILPKEYGGDERSIKTLQAEWLDVLSSDEHLNYLEDLKGATTDESFRPNDTFFENYGGLPGTFRFLKVD